MKRFTLAGLFGLLLLLLSGCDVLGLGGGDGGSGLRLEGVPGKIVFAAERLDEDGQETDDGNVYVIDSEGFRRLTDFGEGTFAINPTFSPDGRTVAFASSLNSTTLGPSLYLIGADGADLRLFKRYPSGVPAGVGGWDPAWSPSGDRLAYAPPVGDKVSRWTSEAVAARIELTEAYELSAYPNPARGRATIELAVRETQDVTVRVYDVLGRRVATVHEGLLSGQERHRLSLKTRQLGLTSGTYFVRAHGDTFVATRRLTVVR